MGRARRGRVCLEAGTGETMRLGMAESPPVSEGFAAWASKTRSQPKNFLLAWYATNQPAFRAPAICLPTVTIAIFFANRLTPLLFLFCCCFKVFLHCSAEHRPALLCSAKKKQYHLLKRNESEEQWPARLYLRHLSESINLKTCLVIQVKNG